MHAESGIVILLMITPIFIAEKICELYLSMPYAFVVTSQLLLSIYIGLPENHEAKKTIVYGYAAVIENYF